MGSKDVLPVLLGDSTSHSGWLTRAVKQPTRSTINRSTASSRTEDSFTAAKTVCPHSEAQDIKNRTGYVASIPLLTFEAPALSAGHEVNVDSYYINSCSHNVAASWRELRT